MPGSLRIATWWSIGLVMVVAAVIALLSTRHPAQPPIQLNGPVLTVQNQTDQEWRNVIVTVNAYYRGQAASLAPRGRLDISLRTLMTGLGQYFNPAREAVRTVQVRATDAGGRVVELEWPEKKVP